MNKDKLIEILKKIPFVPLVGLYVAYLGYDYYEFLNDPGATLALKQGDLTAAQAEAEKLKGRVKAANDFLKRLDVKKQELRRLAQDLDDTKAVLSDSLDVPAFMDTVVTEAKRSGITVIGLKPGEQSKHEYYHQQTFDLSFRGAFVQVVGFFDRISNMQKIVRMDNFNVKPVSGTSSKIVELQGTVQLKAYRYAGSKADELAKKGSESVAPPPPPTPSKAPSSGGGLMKKIPDDGGAG